MANFTLQQFEEMQRRIAIKNIKTAPIIKTKKKLGRPDLEKEQERLYNEKKIIESYRELKNIWKVGEVFGMKGQKIHYILKKHNIDTSQRGAWTDDETKLLIELYANEFLCGDNSLESFCKKINKLKSNVCRKAKNLGLDTSRKRKFSEDKSKRISQRAIERIKTKGHPKGMLGKNHTQETKDNQSVISINRWLNLSEEEKSNQILKSQKTKSLNGNLVNPRIKTTWKQGWRNIGGYEKYYRSRWEANYARYLQFLKENNQIKDWKHEPTTFWFEDVLRGCRSYLPDFLVTLNNDLTEYHEVKGWMDDRSKTKLKRMAKYHPNIKIILIEAKWFKENNKKFKTIISNWE